VADIKLLHWNIQTWSDKKSSNVNARALLNYVAHVILESKANIVSLLEVHSSYADAICQHLLASIITILQIQPRACPWRYYWIDSGEREAYVTLVKYGNNFVAWNAGKSDKQICGLSNQAKVTEQKGTLEFCSTSSPRGGRLPYYTSFKTTDTNKKFTVVAYHAMYGDSTPDGVRSAGLLAQNKAVNDSGVAIALDASLPSGDYNVHYEVNQWAYANLLGLPSWYATKDKTSLKAYTPPEGYSNSMDYRSSAYDNIFFYNGKKPSNQPVGRVFDLIKDSTLPKTGTGLLSRAITNFARSGIRNEILLGKIPPASFEDSWHIVRDAISDHLPVVIEVTI
jgi:hypothetical protein